MADAPDSKSGARKGVRVRVPPSVLRCNAFSARVSADVGHITLDDSTASFPLKTADWPKIVPLDQVGLILALFARLMPKAVNTPWRNASRTSPKKLRRKN